MGGCPATVDEWPTREKVLDCDLLTQPITGPASVSTAETGSPTLPGAVHSHHHYSR